MYKFLKITIIVLFSLIFFHSKAAVLPPEILKAIQDYEMYKIEEWLNENPARINATDEEHSRNLIQHVIHALLDDGLYPIKKLDEDEILELIYYLLSKNIRLDNIDKHGLTVLDTLLLTLDPDFIYAILRKNKFDANHIKSAIESLKKNQKIIEEELKKDDVIKDKDLKEIHQTDLKNIESIIEILMSQLHGERKVEKVA